jgi:RNA polymerase I-specific transcription initiation factor RRN3
MVAPDVPDITNAQAVAEISAWGAQCAAFAVDTLAAIVEAIPQAMSLLPKMVDSVWPYRTSAQYKVRIFMQHVLVLAFRLPTLRKWAYEKTIHYMVQIDAELEELDPLLLDGLMVLVLEYYASLGVTERDEFYGHLLGLFESVLLHTQRSQYVQYLLFILSAQSQQHVHMFLTLLSRYALSHENSIPIRLRIAAAAYLGSYLARASFVSNELALETVEKMVEFALVYMKQHEALMASPDIVAHGLFYAVSQSLFYASCFFPNLVKNNRILCEHMDLIIRSSLNPLMVVLPHIRVEFTLSVMRCDDILARNRAMIVRNSVCQLGKSPVTEYVMTRLSRTRATDSFSHLDQFFPFDPYTLPASRIYVDPLYRQWQGASDKADAVLSQSLESSSLGDSFMFEGSNGSGMDDEDMDDDGRDDPHGDDSDGDGLDVTEEEMFAMSVSPPKPKFRWV